MPVATTAAGCSRDPSRAGRGSPSSVADTSVADAGVSVAPPDTTWHDPASHRAGYVSNAGVRLHFLDFGGQGEPLVLLTGLGSSAHIFDDLAPDLTDRFRVIAMTRRGHAESDHVASGYTLDRLVGDLRAVLDSLGLGRVHLAGHSIAGGELTRFALLYPDRVLSLIYLDALLDPVGLDRVLEADTIRVKATAEDLESYESARSWFQRCFYGFWAPALEADFRINNTSGEVPDQILGDAMRSPVWRSDYSRIRAPVLVLYTLATLERRRPCVARSTDQARVRRARQFHEATFQPYQLRGIELLRRQMPHARIVELQGHHFLFISNEAEVVRHLRAFLRSKP
jgi:non-heme chloroperoxidase